MPEVETPKIRRLREKRDQLRTEIREVTAEIGRLEKHLGRSAKGRVTSVGLRRPNARRLNETTVPDAVVKLLREKRKPMHYKEITRILIKEGRYRTKSKNFLSTVAISIMRDPRIERLEPGVYKLRAGA